MLLQLLGGPFKPCCCYCCARAPQDQKRRSVLEVDGGPEGGVQAVGDVPRFGGSEEATGSDAGGLSRDGQLISGCDDEWGTAALAASVERALQEAAAVAGAEQEGTQPGEGISSSGSRVRRRLRNFSRRWPLERGGEGLAAGEQVHRDGGSLGRQLRADLQQQEQQQQRIVGRVQEGTDEEDQQANANKVEERGGDGRGSGSGGKLPAMHRLANGAVPGRCGLGAWRKESHACGGRSLCSSVGSGMGCIRADVSGPHLWTLNLLVAPHTPTRRTGTVSSYMASCMQYHLPLEEVRSTAELSSNGALPYRHAIATFAAQGISLVRTLCTGWRASMGLPIMHLLPRAHNKSERFGVTWHRRALLPVAALNPVCGALPTKPTP